MDLAPDERVIWEGHPSMRASLKFLLLGLVAAAAAGALGGLISEAAHDERKTSWTVVPVLVVLAILLVWAVLKRLATRYTATDRRLIVRKGLISRNVEQSRLERVQTVNTRQGVIDRMLGIGTIEFDTASGEADEDLRFAGIGDPHGVAERIDRATRPA